MRNLKAILKDLKITLEVKNDIKYSKRVYVHACNTPEEQTKFNLVADIKISSSLSFDKLESGEIKQGQRTEWFVFELLDAVVCGNPVMKIDEDKAFHFRKYIDKEITIKELKKRVTH